MYSWSRKEKIISAPPLGSHWFLESIQSINTTLLQFKYSLSNPSSPSIDPLQWHPQSFFMAANPSSSTFLFAFLFLPAVLAITSLTDYNSSPSLVGEVALTMPMQLSQGKWDSLALVLAPITCQAKRTKYKWSKRDNDAFFYRVWLHVHWRLVPNYGNWPKWKDCWSCTWIPYTSRSSRSKMALFAHLWVSGWLVRNSLSKPCIIPYT